MAVRAGQKEVLDEYEKRLEELRKRFDMHFQGSKEQRIPPTSAQAKLGGELRRVREEETRNWNTQDRFRFNQIFARYVSMDRVWARTLKQIEDGTHKRDKFRLKRAKAEEQAASPAAGPPSTSLHKRSALDSLEAMDVDVAGFDDGDTFGSQPAQPKPVAPPPRTPERPAARAPAPTDPGMSEQRLKQLYDVYVQAKRRTGETSSLTLDGLRAQLAKQVPSIKAKHNCNAVDFKVVLKDGKAMLKAIPK